MRPVVSCSATLKSKGLEENTVVMFVSDNGWPGKDKVYPSELGMRTPITIKWPGKVEPKMDVSNMASNIDLAPTILSIAGLETHPMMPGIDLLDFDVVEKRKYVFGDNYHHDMLQADRPEASLRGRVLVSKQWKLIVWQAKQPDLREDPMADQATMLIKWSSSTCSSTPSSKLTLPQLAPTLSKRSAPSLTHGGRRENCDRNLLFAGAQKNPKRMVLRALKMEPPVRVELTT